MLAGVVQTWKRNNSPFLLFHHHDNCAVYCGMLKPLGVPLGNNQPCVYREIHSELFLCLGGQVFYRVL